MQRGRVMGLGVIAAAVALQSCVAQTPEPDPVSARPVAQGPRRAAPPAFDLPAWQDPVTTPGRPEPGLPPPPPPGIAPLPGASGEHWFDDVTEEAGIDLDRVPRDDYISVVDRMSGGVCVLNADGRLPLDLYFAIRPRDGTASRLYVAQGPWIYEDETAARGLASVEDAVGCLAFDMEGDGDDDLLVTGVGSLWLFENNRGIFVDRSERLGVTLDPRDMYASASAGDVDGDGDLDLLIAGMLRYDPGSRAGLRCGIGPCEAFIYAFRKLPNLLLIREDGRYQDRARTMAPSLMADEPTLVVSISDLDGDGSIDLYVGNDLGGAYYDRALRRRADGSYLDVGDDMGLSMNRLGFGIDTMGFSSGDIDGNGWLDHVVTSFESDATAVFMCHAGGCTDRADTVGTYATRRSLRWGAALADLDNDGDNDLVEATGHYHTDEEIDAIGFGGTHAQPANLMRNLGDGTLSRVPLSGRDGLSTRRASRGLAVADLDDDGLLDVVLAPAIGPPALLRNRVEPRGHFLRIILQGRAPNAPAAGARVTVSRGEQRWIREKRIGEGYLGNFDPRLHFGIPGDGAVEVTVRWPSGMTSRRSSVPVDTELIIIEP